MHFNISCCLLGYKISFLVFFGLFLSKPSKVGKSYKLCLSGPTTVNTSHAENQTATKDKDNDIYTNRNTKTQTKKKNKYIDKDKYFRELMNDVQNFGTFGSTSFEK